MSSIEKREESQALVVGGGLNDFLALCEAQNLTPIEVTDADAWETITINVKHHLATGETKWDWTADGRLDGIQMLAHLALAQADIFKEHFKREGRPKLKSGQLRVLVQLDNDRLSIAVDDASSRAAIRGVLAAALWELIFKEIRGAEGDLGQAAREWSNHFVFELAE